MNLLQFDSHKNLLRPFLAVVLSVLINLSALAKDALSPQEAPAIFFEAVYKMNYAQAWQILTRESQDKILQLIIKQEKDPKLKADYLRKLFEEADRSVQRGFWTQMRASMDIQAWAKQKFSESRPGDKNGEAFVYVTPADIFVFVKQEEQHWKFGFIESFEQKRKPKLKPGEKPRPQTPSSTGVTQP